MEIKQGDRLEMLTDRGTWTSVLVDEHNEFEPLSFIKPSEDERLVAHVNKTLSRIWGRL